MMKYGLAVAAAALVLIPSGSEANNRWEREAREKVEIMARYYEGAGWSQVGETHINRLGEGVNRTLTFPLEAGRTYLFSAACDNDCHHLDLHLQDPRRNEVAADIREDNVPVLRVVAAETGDYRLRVRMRDCSYQPCRYGVILHRQ